MPLNRRISDQIDQPKDKREYVRNLFASVSSKYDLTNDIMSLGLHRRWKRHLVALAELQQGHNVLDLAAGTGDLGREVLAVGTRHKLDLNVTAADMTPEMIQVGRERTGLLGTKWVAGDAVELPFPDESFDRVLLGYGLRNFTELEACLGEILRCLARGGRLLTLDFGHPPMPLIRKCYYAYLNTSTRIVGWAIHRDPESYVYIPESLRRFPGQREVMHMMQAVGYEACGFEELLCGTMAINFGNRPAD